MMRNRNLPETAEQQPSEAQLAALVADLLNSTELRGLAAAVGRHWLRDWSDHHRLKRLLAKPAAWALSKSLAPSDGTPLTERLQKPEHVETLAAQIPQMLRGLGPLLVSLVGAVEKLPTAAKQALLDRMLAGPEGVDDGAAHSLLAGLARIAEDLYRHDPLFFSTRLSPLLDRWLGSTDFGELQALLAAGREDLRALIGQAISMLFEYPAKLVALLALVPDGLNLGIGALHDLLGHVNTLPPDIFTDLLLSIYRQVDATLIGQSVNRANEAIRQLHTGSTLIGEMDAPRFSNDLRDKLRDVAAQIDPALAIKARAALIDSRETLIRILIDTAQERPELLNLWLRQLAEGRNAEIRLFKRKIEAIETLPADDAVAALGAGLSSWNAYDLAETVNSLARLANRIGRLTPEVFKSLVTEFVNTLDLDELEESLARLAPDLARAIRPAFRRLAPPLIGELCAFFTPGEEDDGCDDAMQAAREQLRRLLLGEEQKG
jgi:hypothetical protein